VEIILAVTFLIVFVLYFLPSIVAGKRQHPNQWAIFWLNLLLGWTGIAWLGAMLRSISATDRPSGARPRS
jgi:hypothetical protein